MTLEIKLTPERLARLKAAAEARGMEPETFVEDMLDSLPPITKDEKDEEGEGTLADAFEGLIGGFRSGKGHERLSENTGKKFTEILLEKRRQGRL